MKRDVDLQIILIRPSGYSDEFQRCENLTIVLLGLWLKVTMVSRFISRWSRTDFLSKF